MTQPQGYVLTQDLPAIPAKRYFTIGEVSTLCGVRSYVLRYWEQEFEQLRPMKRRGNRRYYQHHEVLLVRKIRALLYEEGYTIAGARQQLDVKVIDEPAGFELLADNTNELELVAQDSAEADDTAPTHNAENTQAPSSSPLTSQQTLLEHQVWINELKLARDLLNH
jgi:DNA-binding transcriptional MerR regulator